MSSEAAAQFNARGRGPRSGGGSSATQPRPSATTPKAAVEPADRDATLIARYEKLIIESPGEEVPLTRLAELVRKRDGNLDSLLASLEEKAQTGPDQYESLVAWGGILSKDEQLDAAISRLTEASKLRPDRPEAWKLLGQLHQTGGNTAAARASYEKALPLASGPERSILVRTLRDLSLDSEDYEAASKYHRTLTKEAQGNLFLKGELGRELLRRGQTARAVEELKRVVDEAHGDARAKAPALKDLGEAQLEAGQIKDAISSLEKASRLSVASPGLRTAIDTLRAEAHRKDGSLGQFLEELETSANTAPRLGLLGQLLEEEGNTARAIAAYERALQRSPHEIDLRLRLVRLYEVTGDIEKAVVEYGQLAKSSPRDVQLSLRYAEMLLAQGQRQNAIAELDRIDRITSSDPEAGLLLLDFAERLEEKDRSRRILDRLSRARASDPRFLVELGSRYYQNGNTETAHKTWKKILTLGQDKAKAYLTYGEVLIDHESAEEGVDALREATKLAPDDLRAKKALALGLERAAAQEESGSRGTFEEDALKAWHQVLETGTQTKDPTAESTRSLARRHIVRLWKRTGQLGEALRPLEQRLRKIPPDLEAGRLLAEAYIASRADQKAIETLKAVLESAPGDRNSLLLLESVHTRAGHHKEAISVLERLVEADPRRAREYYERMARAAAARNDRTQALQYAELAVQKSPTDPAAQASLGDLYLNQGKFDEAEAAYRRALAQDDRLHAVSLKLADILAKTGRSAEALDVLFHVTRSARNLEAVGTAARRAISVSVPMGEARRVEDVLRPLAISHPRTPIYRSVLLEVLSSQMYPLLLKSNHGEKDRRNEALSDLRELADRSTGPLLLALSGTNLGEQQIAISLLAHSSKKSAASGLLAFAEGAGPEDQRLLAILALGQHDSPELSERLSSMVSYEGTPRRGRIPRAAVWALSHSGATRGLPTLLEALELGDPELRAYAALALADLNDISAVSRRRAISLLRETLKGVEHGNVTRSAAALALGRLAQATDLDEKERRRNNEAFFDAFFSPSTMIQRSALIALSQNDSGAEVKARIATGLLSPEAELRATAAHAATILNRKSRYELPPLLPNELKPAEMDARSRVKEALGFSLQQATAERRHEALVLLENDIISQARVALRASAATAAGVLEQLSAEQGKVLFGRLLVRGDLDSSSRSLDAALESAERIRSSLKNEVLALATGPDPSLAARALLTLRPADSGETARILAQKLDSESTEIHAAALRAILENPTVESLRALSPYLESETSWGRRRRAATALAQLVSRPLPEEVLREVDHLLALLARDANPLVRGEATSRR